MAGWIDASIAEPARTPAGGPDLIDVSGSPFEQGFRHGQLAASTIAGNIAVVDEKVARFTERQREVYRDILTRNETVFAERLPHLFEEVRGIAEGSGLQLPKLLELNLPAYFVVGAMQECSQIVIGGERTADGSTLLAKTRDLPVGDVRNIVLRRAYPDGTRLVEGTVAGSVTWPGSGLNSHGVAMATSGVWSRRVAPDWSRAGHGWFLVNSHELLRQATSAKEFLALAERQPRFTGINLTVADPGAAYAVELTATTTHARSIADGHLAVANHYQSPELAALTPTESEYPGSFHRVRTTVASLAAHRSWSGSRLAELLASHDGYPQQSLCRHEVSADELAGGHVQTNNVTAYASIANVTDLSFSIVLGNPCEAES
jgi:predicted choloylglycine hydrolase